jgi:integrase
MALKFTRLTRPAIRALQPDEKLNEHGITAERTRAGDVRYSVNVMVDGVRIHRVVGRESEGVTREQAERLVEKLRTDARAERLDLPQGRKLHMTLAEAAPRYLERMEQSGGKDLVNKRRHLDRYLVPALGRNRLDGLTEFELRKYRKRRTGEGASDATVDREFAILLHLLNRAASKEKEWRWIKPEDIPDIPRVEEQRKARRALTAEQAESLMKAAVADHDGRLWLFVAIGLGTGMRHTEILSRRYDEIDWGANRFEIEKAKAGAWQQPFPLWLREALLRQQAMEDDGDGWLFPAFRRQCKQPHRTSMDDGFRRAVKSPGLDPVKVTPQDPGHGVALHPRERRGHRQRRQLAPARFSCHSYTGITHGASDRAGRRG